MEKSSQTYIEQVRLINDLAALQTLADQLAGRLRGGETIELVSDLGGGKTAFVRCLAASLKARDAVASPSFTIENIYRTPSFEIHHFDFYRLEVAGICAFELAEVLGDAAKLVIVEWAQIVADILPDERLRITIRPAVTEAEPERRSFSLSCPAELKYLLNGS